MSAINIRIWGAGEGRRPWATTISLYAPHISFFVFWQPWATTIYPSVPPYLILRTNYFFKWYIKVLLNVIFENPAASCKKAQLMNHFFNSTYLINILCVEFFNCFTMKFLANLTEYCILKYHNFKMDLAYESVIEKALDFVIF